MMIFVIWIILQYLYNEQPILSSYAFSCLGLFYSFFHFAFFDCSHCLIILAFLSFTTTIKKLNNYKTNKFEFFV